MATPSIANSTTLPYSLLPNLGEWPATSERAGGLRDVDNEREVERNNDVSRMKEWLRIKAFMKGRDCVPSVFCVVYCYFSS